jgi:thioredoxin 1
LDSAKQRRQSGQASWTETTPVRERFVGIKEIKSDEDFKKITGRGILLVDVDAPWCAPCHAQAPILEALSKRFKKEVVFARLDIDNHRKIAMKLLIQSIPTLILYRNGKEVRRFVGVQPEDALFDAIHHELE